MKTSHKLAIGAGVAALGTIAVRYLRGARTIARHVDDYAQHWGRGHHHTDGVIHYVALGDSAAQRVGASSVEASYVSIIAERLREATRRPVVVTNLSVSGAVSGVARVPEVRVQVNEMFRRIVAESDYPAVVVEGRDITTVVAPDAPVRILLTAAPEVRAARRAGELAGENAAAVAEALHKRDASDSTVVDFLNAADGVDVVDSTELDFAQTVDAVLTVIAQRRDADRGA